MKILFINISDIIGGAAIAAARLGRGLEKEHNTSNYFVVRSKASDNPNVIATRKNQFQQIVERWFNVGMNLFGLQYQYLPFSPQVILSNAKEIKPDIISLHNTLGGYFATPILPELSKIAPVVWTLHDMWAFTGNSAHTFGDESWKQMHNSARNTKIFPQIGLNTGSWLLRQKKKLYAQADVTIVSPSKWLNELAKQSPVFQNKTIVHIPNGVDMDLFHPVDMIQAKKELNIPPDEKVLVFGAEKLKNNPYKGGNDLIEILRQINQLSPKKIHLLILGMGELENISSFENFVIHPAGYIKEEKQMAHYMAAADIHIYPSRADNLPNSIIEASAAGTPTVTFDVGGCAEIIDENKSGFVIKDFNHVEFAEKTVALLSDEKMLQEFSIAARNFAMCNYSLTLMAGRYYELFQGIANLTK